MSIKEYWGTVEKMQQKSKNRSSFEKYLLKFLKKLEKYSEKIRGNF